MWGRGFQSRSERHWLCTWAVMLKVHMALKNPVLDAFFPLVEKTHTPTLPNSQGHLAPENHKRPLKSIRSNAVDGGIGSNVAQWDWHGLMS